MRRCAFVLWYVAGEGSEEFESVELMSSIVLGGVGNDIILDREFVESEGPEVISVGDLLFSTPCAYSFTCYLEIIST
jgi:hypothetical protein